MKRFSNPYYKSLFVGFLLIGISLVANPVQLELSKLASFEVWMNSSESTSKDTDSDALSSHLLSTWSYFHDAQVSVNTTLPEVETRSIAYFFFLGGFLFLCFTLFPPKSMIRTGGFFFHLAKELQTNRLRYCLSPNAP